MTKNDEKCFGLLGFGWKSFEYEVNFCELCMQ